MHSPNCVKIVYIRLYLLLSVLFHLLWAWTVAGAHFARACVCRGWLLAVSVFLFVHLFIASLLVQCERERIRCARLGAQKAMVYVCVHKYWHKHNGHTGRLAILNMHTSIILEGNEKLLCIFIHNSRMAQFVFIILFVVAFCAGLYAPEHLLLLLPQLACGSRCAGRYWIISVYRFFSNRYCRLLFAITVVIFTIQRAKGNNAIRNCHGKKSSHSLRIACRFAFYSVLHSCFTCRVRDWNRFCMQHSIRLVYYSQPRARARALT